MGKSFGAFVAPRYIVFILVVLVSLAWPALAKRKDDAVVMKNGDRITGEIRKLQTGVLYVKPGYALEPIALNWSQVERVESQDIYLVVLTNGKRYTGTIQKVLTGQPAGEVAIKGEREVIRVPEAAVVSIGPVEPSFWKQLKGAVDYGLSYQQGGDHTQSTLSGSVDYPQEHYLLHLDGSTVFSGQSRGTNTTRYILDFDDNRYFTRNWYAATMANFLRSSQQDLTARTTLGGGAGHDLVRTDRTNFSGVVGLVYDNEHYSDVSGQPAPTNSLESLLAVNFNTYRFRTTQINSQLAVLPSLTDAGRIRFVSNSYVMLEIVHNLFWKLSVYENYDSRPPTSAPKNDFGVTTSFGWKFGPGR